MSNPIKNIISIAWIAITISKDFSWTKDIVKYQITLINGPDKVDITKLLQTIKLSES